MLWGQRQAWRFGGLVSAGQCDPGRGKVPCREQDVHIAAQSHWPMDGEETPSSREHLSGRSPRSFYFCQQVCLSCGKLQPRVCAIGLMNHALHLEWECHCPKFPIEKCTIFPLLWISCLNPWSLLQPVFFFFFKWLTEVNIHYQYIIYVNISKLYINIYIWRIMFTSEIFM